MQDPRTEEQRIAEVERAAIERTAMKLHDLHLAFMKAARTPKGAFWRRTARTRTIYTKGGKAKAQVLHATRGWKYA